MALDTNKILFGGVLKCGLFSLFQGSGLVGRSVERSARLAYITFSDSLQKHNLTISASATKASSWSCSADTERKKQADSHLIVSWIREP